MKTFSLVVSLSLSATVVGCVSGSRNAPPQFAVAERTQKTAASLRSIAPETVQRADEALAQAQARQKEGDSVGAELWSEVALAEYEAAAEIRSLDTATKQLEKAEREFDEAQVELSTLQNGRKKLEQEAADLDRRWSTSRDKLRTFQKDTKPTKELEAARFVAAQSIAREADILCLLAVQASTPKLGGQQAGASSPSPELLAARGDVRGLVSDLAKGQTKESAVLLDRSYRARARCLSSLEKVRVTSSPAKSVERDRFFKQLSDLRSKKDEATQNRWLLRQDERGVIVELVRPFENGTLSTVATAALDELRSIASANPNQQLLVVLYDEKTDKTHSSTVASKLGIAEDATYSVPLSPVAPPKGTLARAPSAEVIFSLR
ncbi:MAG: hypothetical protein KBF88_04650 [Polyangiaceae bacterium]|nr:hypothetical protein [Polyangiaceae bacterium]